MSVISFHESENRRALNDASFDSIAALEVECSRGKLIVHARNVYLVIFGVPIGLQLKRDFCFVFVDDWISTGPLWVNQKVLDQNGAWVRQSESEIFAVHVEATIP